MKKRMMAVGVLCVVGCVSSRESPEALALTTLPPNVENVSVVVSPNQDLKSAVVAAATHRRWVPQEVNATTIRCTLTQRARKVVIDVRLLDERHYSIQMVESSVPAKKVVQWVNNLQREIAKHAVR